MCSRVCRVAICRTFSHSRAATSPSKDKAYPIRDQTVRITTVNGEAHAHMRQGHMVGKVHYHVETRQCQWCNMGFSSTVSNEFVLEANFLAAYANVLGMYISQFFHFPPAVLGFTISTCSRAMFVVRPRGRLCFCCFRGDALPFGWP